MNWLTVTSSFLTRILQMDVLDVKSNHLSLKSLLILVTPLPNIKFSQNYSKVSSSEMTPEARGPYLKTTKYLHWRCWLETEHMQPSTCQRHI